ncbi:hypothetical protein EV182_008407, partial [Spiromyces aspiralis]
EIDRSANSNTIGGSSGVVSEKSAGVSALVNKFGTSTIKKKPAPRPPISGLRQPSVPAAGAAPSPPSHPTPPPPLRPTQPVNNAAVPSVANSLVNSRWTFHDPKDFPKPPQRTHLLPKEIKYPSGNPTGS